jgi:hypothetical protein
LLSNLISYKEATDSIPSSTDNAYDPQNELVKEILNISAADTPTQQLTRRKELGASVYDTFR